MKLLTTLAVLAALALAPAAEAAQAAAIPRIEVAGSATVEARPDWVSVTMTVSGEGPSQLEALEAVAAARQRIQTGISKLQGLERARFEADQISVMEVRGRECAVRDDYGARPVLSQGPCAVVGAVATIDLTVTFAPVSKTGDVAAYAVELGALGVRVSGGGLNDAAALRQLSLKQAVANARREAESIAAASGARLGPVLHVIDTDAFRGVTTVGSEQLELTATLQVDSLLYELPRVSVELTPKPVSSSTRVTVVFALLP